ncbi:MAG TPA: hypothetical protein VFW96_20165, partial [Thermomicrobiales bacterium]|nr:hypothetical protein [Thermomicrobiales bacterium]
LAAIQAEFNAGRNATARMLATRASADDPGDAEIAAILERIARRERANRRAAVVEALPRARRLLRHGDAAGALALVEPLDLAGVEPELERQATGLRFAAAEAAAVSRGLDDVRFLRLGAGRVLLAREPGGDGAPVYRVIAAADPVGDRMVGAVADPADVRRSEPRRARK